MHPVSCTNTHHDVTDLVNHGMVKNTKTWISWEQNITFLQNKKILNLCLTWHILRSFCFLAEVTYNTRSEIWRWFPKTIWFKNSDSCKVFQNNFNWNIHLLLQLCFRCYLQKTFSWRLPFSRESKVNTFFRIKYFDIWKVNLTHFLYENNAMYNMDVTFWRLSHILSFQNNKYLGVGHF